MKTNKKEPKVILHIDLSKGRLNLATTSYFEVKDFSELTKIEKRIHMKHTQKLDAKMFWYNHGYLKAIQVYIKSIF